MGLPAGSLSDRITFQLKTETLVAEQVSISWADDFSPWADVQQNSATSLRCIIRFRRPVPTPDTHRILWEGAYWTIISAVHDRRYESITVDCDFSAKVEVTTLSSTTKEFIDGLPTINDSLE